ncbi:tyrosine-protein phosphatase non-receptor type 1-like isoform X2 [Corticium candelabrum]|uniref:tyrosine-protein phosphatase non-receptor type 1-like isoform X2 n=1 Tax=Corticium candelabrum TaxID=121492 RepID=UPI002E265DB7|nr:tyrosine-protein phosphatase non-receptor type 1-like isoform X2 [Corticium candelabrum]
MKAEFDDLDDSQGWVELFYTLGDEARRNAGTQKIAKEPQNKPLNRYKDVHPIDETRVVLREGDVDYINANHVQIPEVERKYILAQGPLERTCGHFWQMVWEQESKGVIMLNRTIEKGMRKCHEYWPNGEEDGDEDEVTFSDFHITLLTKDYGDSYNKSILKLENLKTEETREVLHFHYLRWPDFGVPQQSDTFLDFLAATRNAGVLDKNVGPCVIHCSAGIGRSGTFCLVDACLEMFRAEGKTASLDIPRVLLNMRRQRLGLIQTPDQLRFSYRAIIDGVKYLLGLEEPEETGRVSFCESESEHEDDEPPPIPPRDPDMIERASNKETEAVLPPAYNEGDRETLKRTCSMPADEPPNKREKLDPSEETAAGAQCGTSESEGSSEWEVINGTEDSQGRADEEQEDDKDQPVETTDEHESKVKEERREKTADAR